ncbi:MAG: hypothetical protein K5907_00705 [Treponema sp.]|nr:hypothetical protein [Treponema sp.]
MKKIVALALSAAISLSTVFALDLTFKIDPLAVFPSAKNMKLAPGVNVSGGVDLFGLVTAGVEGGYVMEKPNNVADGINILSGGLNLGVYYYPLSRLYVGIGGGFGVDYISSQISENESGEGTKDSKKAFSDLYYRAFGEVGFRLNPSVSINAVGGWTNYTASMKDAFISGPFAGISFRINAQVGNKGSNSTVSVKIVQDTDVYPVYSSVYGYEPFGTIIVRNNDGAELRNVRVSFRANKYTTAAKLCGSVSRINRHKTEEFPLYADFSTEILQFTENGKISGEVVIEYEFLGKKMTVVEPVIVSVNNRNAFVWSDNAGLSAFISPDGQEIAMFAKEVAGITRNNIYTGMNANLQYAAGMVEALRLVGVTYSGDTITPYASYHQDFEMDSIQYPLQTLQYLSGDYDDLGILLCACLQTVNVPTGYMPINDDFIVLVKLGIGANQALSNFASTDGLVIDEENDVVYLALSMANLEKGFTASYKAGSNAVAKCFEDEENYYEFIDTTDAWNVYKPVAYSTNTSVAGPKQDALIKNIKSAIQSYIDSDIEQVIKRARAEGNANKLGVALVRAGRYSEAKREFQKLNTVAAMNNTANIYMIEKNYTAAAAQYKAVLAKDPNNTTALKGLENANAKIE